MQQLFEAKGTGGATFSLYFGNMVEKPHFAVVLYPEAEHSKSWEGKSLPSFKLRSFIASNHELLKDARNSIGVWYASSQDANVANTFLEVTGVLPFRDKADYKEAIHEGRRYNQQGIYDLEHIVYIETGGTGELPDDVPPVSDRLPVLKRGGGEL